MLKQICDSFLDETMEYNDLPGLVIGVQAGGEQFAGARGVRDVTSRDPLRADDVFHCASVSKLFTSAAIMQLTEAGKLELDQPLREILPELSIADKRWEDIPKWERSQKTCHDNQPFHASGNKDMDDNISRKTISRKT